MSAMPPGSYLVLPHITPDEVSPDARREVLAVYDDATARAYPRRSRGCLTGWRSSNPGMVDVAAWRRTATGDVRSCMAARHASLAESSKSQGR
jgi:hypothetical protein